MFCRNCGEAAKDADVYCRACGAALNPEEELGQSAVTPENLTPETTTSEASAPASENETAAHTKKPHRGRIVAILAAAIVALLAIGAAFVFLHGNGQNQTHTMYFHLNSDVDYGKDDSPIPVRVHGVQSSGEDYDTVEFVTADDEAIEVPTGSYVFTIAASPLMSTGELLDVTGQDYQVYVESDTDEETIETSTLAVIDPADVTDEMLEQAHEYALQSGFEQADDLYDLAVQTRDEAVAERVAAEEEAARQAEEEAARQAAEEEAARQAAEEEAARQAAEEEAARQAAEAAASHDNLTGTYGGSGGMAPNAFTAASLSDTELSVTGDLQEVIDGSFSGSVGNKTWVFAVNENTEFGYAMYDGFHAQSREEFASTFESLNFPGLTLVIEDGVVTRAYTGS